MPRFNNTIDSEKWKCRLTPQRLQRLDKMEKLMIRCFTVDEIVSTMKIGRAIVISDLEFIRKSLLYRQRKEYWKEKIVNTLDLQLKELWEQWEHSKDTPAKIITYDDGRVIEVPGRADPRWQSGILAVLNTAAKVTGIADAANQVEPVIVEEETKKALAPMSVDEWDRMLAKQGHAGAIQAPIDVEVVNENNIQKPHSD